MKDRTDEPLRHDAESLAKACNTVAAELNHDNALELNELEQIAAHMYGFC